MTKTRTLKSGIEVTYAPVSIQQMLVRRQLPPSLVTDVDAAIKDGSAETRALNGEFMGFFDALLAAGITSHRIFLGERSETPEGQLHIMDLGDDYLPIANDILALSGATEEAAEAARFRDRDGAGGDDPRSVEADPAHA